MTAKIGSAIVIRPLMTSTTKNNGSRTKEKNIFEIPHVILIAKIKIFPNTMNIKNVNKKVII